MPLHFRFFDKPGSGQDRAVALDPYIVCEEGVALDGEIAAFGAQFV